LKDSAERGRRGKAITEVGKKRLREKKFKASLKRGLL